MPGKRGRPKTQPGPMSPTWAGELALRGWPRGEVRTGEECSRLGLRLHVLRALERRGLIVSSVSVSRATGSKHAGVPRSRVTVWRRPLVDR
jgi:hypothetical protein